MAMLSRLKPPKKIYSVKAPGDQILLGYDDAKLFDNPIINNLSSTEKSDHVLWGDDDSQSFETPPLQNYSVTAPSVQILLGYD